MSLFHWNEAAEPRDELGIGPLRNLLANTFFPGTTTLQRGAKYFLLVPAMYAAIEADTNLRSSPGDSIVDLEETLLHRLLDRYDDANRVIGGRFRKVPNTPPSAIYWNGLHAWGIRRFNDSRAHYHAVLRRSPRTLKTERHEEGGEEKRVPLARDPRGGSPARRSPPRAHLRGGGVPRGSDSDTHNQGRCPAAPPAAERRYPTRRWRAVGHRARPQRPRRPHRVRPRCAATR